MNNSKNKLKTILVSAIAILASAAVFIKSFTTPNIKVPFLQSLVFSAVICLLAWFALGRPTSPKKKTAEESFKELKLNEFVETPSINRDIFENADSVTCLQKDTLSIDFAKFSSSSSASKAYHNICNSFSQTADAIKYTHEKRQGAYQECAIETKSQSVIVCLDNQTIIFFYSTGSSVNDMIKVKKNYFKQ